MTSTEMTSLRVEITKNGSISDQTAEHDISRTRFRFRHALLGFRSFGQTTKTLDRPQQALGR
jgi:hypothetical protein